MGHHIGNMAISHLARTSRQTTVGFSSSSGSQDDLTAYSESLLRLVALIGRGLLSIFLVGLLALSCVTWIWVASFRKGWKLWDWLWNAKTQGHTENQISYSLLYGAIIFAVSPIILFFAWSQKWIQQWLPDWVRPIDSIPIRQIIEEQLGIELGDALPNIGEPEQTNTNAIEAEETPVITGS